jgi:hypothetical protein
LLTHHVFSSIYKTQSNLVSSCALLERRPWFFCIVATKFGCLEKIRFPSYMYLRIVAVKNFWMRMREKKVLEAPNLHWDCCRRLSPPSCVTTKGEEAEEAACSEKLFWQVSCYLFSRFAEMHNIYIFQPRTSVVGIFMKWAWSGRDLRGKKNH